DVEQIVRDLVETAVHMVREKHKAQVKVKAEEAAEERVLDALVGDNASEDTRQKFRKMLREGQLADREIEIQVRDQGTGDAPSFDIPGMPGGQMSMINLNDMLGGAFGAPMKPKKMSVSASYDILIGEEAEKLVDEEALTKEAITKVETGAIVFLDEVDKIAARAERGGADVSREGVQRDLLPLIEGTTVSTKRGPVKTDHILFIASGAFHVSKPSDLLPELQGRLPIRVELDALTRDNFVQILTDTENSLPKQYTALMDVEGVTLNFTSEAIEELATLAADINASVENIGARRLHTVLEKLLEEISFSASERSGETVTIDDDIVRETVAPLAKDADLSKFIL
ncbi:ATP-dependent protease ATPase subunit HslU, partial [Pseudomonadota bacterium]